MGPGQQRPADVFEEPDDEWEMLDPYATDGIEERPFARGKTFREPRMPKSYLDEQESAEQAYLSVILDPGRVAGRNSANKKLKAPLYQEFMPLYARELARRKGMIKRQQAQQRRRKMQEA